MLSQTLFLFHLILQHPFHSACGVGVAVVAVVACHGLQALLGAVVVAVLQIPDCVVDQVFLIAAMGKVPMCMRAASSKEILLLSILVTLAVLAVL